MELDDLFDIEILREPKGPCVHPALEGLGGSSLTLGVHPLAAPAEAARAACRAVRASGGVAVVIPTRYREAKVTLERARQIAKSQVALRGIAVSKRYGPLVEDGGAGRVWCFYVDDIEAQDAGMAPGRILLWIDRLDEHLWTAEDHHAEAAENGLR